MAGYCYGIDLFRNGSFLYKNWMSMSFFICDRAFLSASIFVQDNIYFLLNFKL